jgi:hypothetical protein
MARRTPPPQENGRYSCAWFLFWFLVLWMIAFIPYFLQHWPK